MNEYTRITDYYDLLMTQGYYDYEGMANAVYPLIKDDRKKILELGVGTGLLAEKLKALAPEAEFTGVDITTPMLEIARKRLGEWGKLVAADVCDMNLQETFDIAVSSGGVWVINQRGDRTDIGSHIKGLEQDIKGLANVAQHLGQNGLLLLSIQGEQKNYQQNLPTGIVYSQEIEKIAENDEIESIEKSYFFKKDGEILAQQKLSLNYIKQWKKPEIMEQAGFSFVGIDESKKFHVYRKR
ncbi:class I SAM-dependent DNA methyltransferase [Dapis sp. BLCC M126]|uniref:class I SAM-dependent DNA methyltransferase n=1 Tax=Dapis sp. BLCC M126 TaxID=3400189 RepID=UPI003CEAED8D